jgi:hypothetical protein
MGSLGKDAAAAAAGESSRVVLAVNGVRREAAGVHPSMTLLEFLRTKTPVRGPKLGCGEGMSTPTRRFHRFSFHFRFVPVRIFSALGAV